MKLTADYHTHTVYSHGKGEVIDNAKEAKAKGLLELGISDHGFAHSVFGLSHKKIPQLKKDCLNASEETGVKVLVGIESNIIGTDGTVDLKEKYYDDFDVFLAGFHKLVLFKPGTLCSLGIPNLFNSTFKKKEVSKSLIRRNTKTFINVIKNNPVDVITHLNFCCYSDAVEVAKAARDYGTYIELNAKKVHLLDEELYKIADTGVRFIISSDAHTPDRVGEISLVEEWLKRCSIDKNLIDNIDGRLPDFRFKKRKGQA